jgi:dynein heavy chain, axonemal
VHLRDLIEELLSSHITCTENFKWTKQLRYYFNVSTKDVFLLQCFATLSLSYEYLGNCSRLVITNLTDRCYLTMTGALSLCMGGNPNGPAGTGKTETIKDISKSL